MYGIFVVFVVAFLLLLKGEAGEGGDGGWEGGWEPASQTVGTFCRLLEAGLVADDVTMSRHARGVGICRIEFRSQTMISTSLAMNFHSVYEVTSQRFSDLNP